MKTIRLAIGVATTPALILALFLAVGCGKKESNLIRPAPSGVQESAEKNSFKEVTSHLDAGGSMYVYYSTEHWLDGLSDSVNDWRSLFTGLPAVTSDDRQKIGRVFDVVTGLIKDSGVEEISGYGASSIARDKGFYHTTSVLHHYSGRNSGYLWSMFGKEAHNLDGVDMLPTTTAMAFFCDMDLGMLWSAIEKETDKLGIPEVRQELDTVPAQFAQATGLSLDKVLASLGNEYGLVITLDDTHMVTLPVPGTTMSFPEPGIMLVVKVKNDVLFDRLDAEMQGNPQVIKTDRSGFKMRTMPVPVPLPISLRPSIARGGDYFFLASTDSMIEEALAIKAGKKPGLKSTDEFKKLAQDVPDKGNQFVFVSEKFSRSIYKLQDDALQAANNRGRGNAAQAELMKKLEKYRRISFAYRVSANTDEGWVSSGNTSQDPANIAVLLPAIAVGGVLAAIAVPNFVRARTTAQGNACINNLRQIDGAKQQWALENKITGNATPTWNDIRRYMGRGVNGTIPQCPQGGTYTINPLDQLPTCSIPGHNVPN